MDVQNPLRRGIFVNVGSLQRVWVPFKYETLLVFCFGCGRLGHFLLDCDTILEKEKGRSEEEQPYSMALKAESNVLGKESFRLNLLICKGVQQSSYVGVPITMPELFQVTRLRVSGMTISSISITNNSGTFLGYKVGLGEESHALEFRDKKEAMIGVETSSVFGRNLNV